MKKINTALIILLAISICFNIFFIFGYLYSRTILEKIKTVEGRMELLANRLNLTQSQKVYLIRLRKELELKIQKNKESKAAEVDAFWLEMAKDNPDHQKIEDMLESSSAQQEKVRIEVEFLRNIFTLLTPEQRQAFVEIIRKKNFFGNN